MFRRFVLFRTDPNDPGGGGNPAGDKPEGSQPPKTFTQEELDRIVQREKIQARDAEKRAQEAMLADKLGVSVEEAAKLIKAEQDRQNAEKSEAQRAREAADQEKAAAAREREAAKAEAHSTKVLRALLKAGVNADKADKVARLVDVEVGADQEAIDAAVSATVDEFPEVVGTADQPATVKKPPSSDPQGGKPKTPQVREDAKKRGRDRALAMMGKKPPE